MLRTTATGVLATVLVATGAAAQSPVDEGVRLYEEADLEGALAALESAVEGPLSRAEVLRLLATRALVRFGLGYFEPLERDLLAIACLEPDYELGVRAPPPLQAAYARLRERVDGPLRVVVRLEALEAGVRLRAETEGDRAGIVERVALTARRAGAGQWQRAEDGTLVLPVLSGDDVELHAEAIGPGGAVLATDGTREQPQTQRVPPYRGDVEAPVRFSPLAKGTIVVASAVLVVAAVVLAVVLSGDDPQSVRPEGPFIER